MVYLYGVGGPKPAVDKYWLGVAVVVYVSDATQEVEDGGWVTRHTKIRPGNVVKLVDLSHFLRVSLKM